MKIVTNDLSIYKLLSVPNEQFVIPSYQRRYAWKYNQFLALFEDIDMLKDGDGHLFGTIILHSDTHTGGINKPEVIDGQQRLTTLILLLKAFEISYQNIGNNKKAEEVRSLICCKDRNDKEFPKLVLGDLDNNDMEGLIMNNDSESLSNDKIREAYNYFLYWLSERSLENLNNYYYNLVNVAVIIRLDVLKAQDAFKLFETINNRGLRLTPTDIIKNFLLGHASKIDSLTTLDTVKKLWSKIITNLDGIDTDDFLRQFICSIYTRKVTFTMLVHDFKKYYLSNIEQAELLGEYEYYDDYHTIQDEEEDEAIVEENTKNILKEHKKALPSKDKKYTIITFLEFVEKRSQVYRKLALAKHENLKINRKIINLNRILSKPTYIFLMNYLLDDKYSVNEQIKVLGYLETLMLRRHICEKRTSENDDIFSKLVGYLGDANILDKIDEYMIENDHMPNDSDFEISFSKHQFKGRLIERAKYVLESIEYYLNGNTGEIKISSNEEVHLEHIIPQVIDTKRSKTEFGDWITYLGDKSKAKHKKYVNYIGNMTLLGEALNIQAYNNPFGKKKASYKKSAFKITQELSKQNDFKFSHVDKRGEQLTEYALKIWKV